ncbi:Alpha/beta hydrolase nvfD [Cladobotryum mycophilum]|uniref:Alpha/beta hydrolase nvfD n=1 Tax=Cladobotryum mycophilum TaxID=491253 RepID=A0ABR0T3K7_9HYPO
MADSLHEKPTIAIVPGQWHIPEHYEDLITHLLNAGYPTRCVQLPSCNSPDPENQSVERDAQYIVQHLLQEDLNAGRDILVVMHSYGAVPGSVAIKGWSRDERLAMGYPGGIIGVVMMCGVLVPNDCASLEYLRLLGPWSIINNGQVEVRSEYFHPAALLYNRSDTDVAEWAVELLKPHSVNVLLTPVASPAWMEPFYDDRRAYISCHDDNCLPFAVQKEMLDGTNLVWRRMVLQTSDHTPWLSKPDHVYKFIDDLANRWRGQPTMSLTN